MGKLWRTLVVVVAFSVWARAGHADFVPPWLTGESRPSDLSISLVTMGPGDDVHQYFGHTALEVRDKRLGIAALYNFGTFGFDEAFLLKFLKGRLEFWVGVQSTRQTYEFYADQDRDVRLLELNLPPDRLAVMARDLAVAALPENRTYLYHHYRDNCATRIVDAIDKATDGAFKRSLQEPARLTFRGHTRRYAAQDPLIDWLLIFAMNDSMEEPIRRVDELFLPEELEQAVAAFRFEDGRSLVKRRVVFHEAQTARKVYDVPPTTWPYTLGIGVGLGALLLWVSTRRERSRAARMLQATFEVSYGLLFGTLGLVLASLALFTEHTVTYWNENLFFVHPLLLVLVPVAIGHARRARWAERVHAPLWLSIAALGVLGILLKVLPNFDQDNTLVWTLVLPITLAGALGASVPAGWPWRVRARVKAAPQLGDATD